MDLQSNDPPWKEKGISKNARLMAGVGLYLTSFTTCFCIIFSIYLVIEPSPKTGDFWNDTFPYILLTAVVGGLLFSTMKLFRLSFAPISFTPSYSPVRPSDLGKAFDVYYQESLGYGRSVSFIGSLTFQPDGLELPFRGDSLSVVPYKQVQGMTIKGRHIAFRLLDDAYVQIIVNYTNNKSITFDAVKSSSLNKALRSARKPKVSLYVSEMDGERMYRELKRHFPSVVSQYIL